MKLKKKEQHVFLKLVEELNELSTELLHAINKPSKANATEILAEIKDVEDRISAIKDILDK